MAAAAAPRLATQQVPVKASMAATAGGPALNEEELLMASGAYNPLKFNEYQRQVRDYCDHCAHEDNRLLSIIFWDLSCKCLVPWFIPEGGHGDGAQGA